MFESLHLRIIPLIHQRPIAQLVQSTSCHGTGKCSIPNGDRYYDSMSAVTFTPKPTT